MNVENRLLNMCYETTKDIYIDNIPYYHIIATTIEKAKTYKENTYLISKILIYSDYSLEDIDKMGFVYDYELLDCLIRENDETIEEFAYRALSNEDARILLFTEHTEIWHRLDTNECSNNEKRIVISNVYRDSDLYSDCFKESYKICGILGGIVFALRDYITGITVGLDVYVYDYKEDNVIITYFNYETNSRQFKSKYTVSKDTISRIKQLIYDKVIRLGYKYEDPEFALNQTQFDYWPNYKALDFRNWIDDKKSCFYRIRNDYYTSKDDAPISKSILDVKDEIFKMLIDEGATELCSFTNNTYQQISLF